MQPGRFNALPRGCIPSPSVPRKSSEWLVRSVRRVVWLAAITAMHKLKLVSGIVEPASRACAGHDSSTGDALLFVQIDGRGRQWPLSRVLAFYPLSSRTLLPPWAHASLALSLALPLQACAPSAPTGAAASRGSSRSLVRTMKFLLNVILTSAASAFTHVSLYGLRAAVTPSAGHLVRAFSPLEAPPAAPATRGQQRPALVGRTRHALRMCGTAATHNLTVSTFNLLCPAYRRVPGKPDNVREADTPEDYLKRNKQILFLPLFAESDVICCQEFWYSNAEVFNLYVNALNSKYRMHGLQRPGPGGSVRPDGLFMAISREFEVVHEAVGYTYTYTYTHAHTHTHTGACGRGRATAPPCALDGRLPRL